MTVAAQEPSRLNVPHLHDAEIFLLSTNGPRKDVLDAIGPGLSIAVFKPSEIETLDHQVVGKRPWIIDIDLSDFQTFGSLRKWLRDLDAPRLVVLETHDRRALLRAQDLSPTDFFVHPVLKADFGQAVRQLLNKEVETRWQNLTQTQRAALRVTLKCLEDAANRIMRDEPLPIEDLKDCIRHILRATQDIELDKWIAALRDHHNYTFRHSMFVSGTISAFAYWLGIRGQDLEKLALGALLHDIGKVKVPATLLDKPAALSPHEWRLMKNHVEYSRKILGEQTWVEPEVVAMAVHHHERLDGSGYPDGLNAHQINDFVRMTAISDTYSALVDKRSYKPALPKEQALRVMSNLKSELDPNIVQKFKEFILH